MTCLKFKITSDVYGIMSSHPAAIMASTSTFRFPIDMINVNLIRVNADDIIQASPISYVRDAKLRGFLFNGFDASTVLVCGVDHKEPEETLNSIYTTRKWLFGILPEFHEYFLVLEGRAR